MANRQDQNTEDEYPRTVDFQPDPQPFDHEETMREIQDTIESWRK